MKKTVFILIIACLTIFQAQAQKGKIRGTVYEEATGETLVGVAVMIEGTFTGTTTDLDGQFTLEVDPGTYNLQLSYISYSPMLIKDVVVKSNEVAFLDNLIMKESAQELMEVVIKAEAVRTNEAAMLTIKKKSTAMIDGISASKIQLTGDNTAVEAAKRVTGVSVEDGKYVYVRGLGDRYSKTTLNNVDIPGLDPDRNSLQMDIFPTSLINNIMISKNFTADMPADFTGGLLNIETKDFPEQRIISVSASVGYNPSMHFNPDYLTYKGSSTDFLGYDDGKRALQPRATQPNIPTPISGASKEEVNEFVRGFNSQLATTRQTSPMDYSASFTIGDQIDIAGKNKTKQRDPKLGYIFSLSYKSDYKYYDDVVLSEYQRYIDPDIYEMRYATIQTGEIGEHSVLIGGLAGLAFKTKLSKYRLTAMRLQNGESRAGKFFINNDGSAVGQSGYFAGSDNLEYNQRALSNVLLNGVHLFEASQWEIDWRLSGTLSSSDDPDIRKTAFTYQEIDTLFSAGAGGNPSRIWRNLDEINTTAKIDITKKYELFGNEAKLKFGVSHTYKSRDYQILFYNVQFFGSQSWPNPDPAHVLDSINLYPNKPNSIYYQSGNRDPNPNEYQANVNNLAGYISQEFNITAQLRAIIGVRVENFVQRYTGRDQAYSGGDTINGKNLVNAKVLESTDLFPSINFIYALTESQNLRASYSRTIARPSFKELSYAQILDPLSNRIFNGSLFVYPTWDGHLIETRIDNVDLRWEWFLEAGQMFSVSAFYKKFKDPIELVRIPEQQTSTEYQTRNMGDGQLYGLEFEFRKDLNFISQQLKHFNLSGNLTLVSSSIDMSETEYNSRVTYKKTGETVKDTRVMAGQSPYVINAGFTYSNPDIGLDAGLFYNVKGATLSIVGTGLFPDIYIVPYNSLNFGLNKKVGASQNTVIDFKISNILNQKVESYYRSYEAEQQLYSSFNPGLSFSIGVSHRF